MKTWLYLIIMILFANVFFLERQEQSGVPDDVLTALQTGNTKDLSTYFNGVIDLSMPENSGVYNKQQAEIIVSGFFRKNDISKFETVQKTENPSGVSLICKIKNQNDDDFVIFMTMYYIEKELKIVSMTIQKNF